MGAHLEKEIRSRVKKAKKTKSLNLDSLEIEFIPKEIFDLEHLEEIILNNNKIIEIPEDLKKLKNLKKLRLSHNNLQFLPNFSDLPKLEVLDLSYYTGKLTKELFDCKSITCFGLRFCQLKEIPQEIFSLENLRILDLRCNNIEFIPTGILALKKLKTLYLDDNPIFYPPPKYLQSIYQIFQYLEGIEFLIGENSQKNSDQTEETKQFTKLSYQINLIKELATVFVQRLEHTNPKEDLKENSLIQELLSKCETVEDRMQTLIDQVSSNDQLKALLLEQKDSIKNALQLYQDYLQGKRPEKKETPNFQKEPNQNEEFKPYQVGEQQKLHQNQNQNQNQNFNINTDTKFGLSNVSNQKIQMKYQHTTSDDNLLGGFGFSVNQTPNELPKSSHDPNIQKKSKSKSKSKF
ncbi:hypothetical protein M0811_00288 [Anaeramoeba ignava]|uniref:GAT domain-containing protein n=1 Tax=Anaeramoeba ignava TaxID=1746090 RepID=A0A9Q0LQ79_ANAIG|nr:hypothetical protein M0811_00288 [Anaeramoeba ignava]